MERLWQTGLLVTLIVALSPGNFAFVGFADELAEKSYALVKASMPFIPFGALLMLVWRKPDVQVVILALYMVLLPALWLLPEWGWAETRNMLFAWPGLALGMSLATASQRAFTPKPKGKSMHHRASHS